MDNDSNGQELPTAFPPPKAAKSKRKIYIGLAIIALLVLLGATIAVVVRTTQKHSKDQQNTIPIFRLDSTNVNINELSSSELSATWDIGFSVQNPTAASVLYQRMDLSLYYKQQVLASATFGSFLSNEGQAWKPVKAKLETRGSPVNGTGVLQDLQAEVAGGSANFNMRLYAGYYIGAESPNRVYSAAEASLFDVEIQFSSGGRKGTLVGSGAMWRITKRW